MSLVEHAARELQLCGQFREDPAYAQSVVAAVAAFASYGHSGGSASCAVSQLTTLLQYGTLSPLTDDPEEWVRHQPDMWQSSRNPQAFSQDGGKTYYLLDEVEEARQAAADRVGRPMHAAKRTDRTAHTRDDVINAAAPAPADPVAAPATPTACPCLAGAR